MEKTVKKIVCFFLAYAGVLLYLPALEGTVVSVKGKVQIVKGENTQTAAVGDTIGKGDMLTTGFKSEAVVKIKESYFTLAALTRVTIEQIAETPAKDETQIFLDSGSVASTVKQSEDKRVEYTVRSAVATASVRGTAFTSGADGSFACSDGAIAVWPTEKDKQQPSVAGEASAGVPAGGESGAGTDVNDVAPAAPRSAVLVLRSQSAAVTESGRTVTPQQRAQSKSTEGASGVMSLSASEAVSSSSASGTSGSVVSEKQNNAAAAVTVTAGW